MSSSTADESLWTSLQIRFEADDKVNSFMMVPAKPPLDFVDLKKLDDAGLANEVDAYLTGLLAEDQFSGTVLIARDGKPLFAKAYGLANREHEIPNQLDTRFSLGSMNKMFTAVAIAQLAEQGKLSFDDPIGKHLPEGWIAAEIGRTVRIRQLLNHTSGLGDFLEAFIESAHYRYQTLDDYKKIVAPETLSFEPGSKWAYSNTGFLLLGVIVSNVSGQDYYDYIREKIYAPAGMKDTDSYDFTRVVPKLADGYYKDEGQWRKNTLMRAPRGTSAGGGYSTVEDLLAFDQALRTHKLLTAEMQDRLFMPDAEVGHGGTYFGVSAHLSIFLNSGYTFVALCNGDGAQKAYMKALTLIEQTK